MDDFYLVAFAVAFHILDMGSGLIAAISKGNLESGKMRDGLFKKVGYLFCYAVAFLLEKGGSQVGVDVGGYPLAAIVAYAVMTELVSIIENVCKINPFILPDKLLRIFKISGEQK